MTTFINGGVSVLRARTIATGLRLYARTGIKPNRAYTPSAMLRAASAMTGEHYKRGEYMRAARDLTKIAEDMQPVAWKRGDIR